MHLITEQLDLLSIIFIFRSPELLGLPIAMGWRQLSCGVCNLLTSSAGELIGQS